LIVPAVARCDLAQQSNNGATRNGNSDSNPALVGGTISRLQNGVLISLPIRQGDLR
jgi:hypothetical protein